jgi:FAD/FMN-containing dehydrogenase
MSGENDLRSALVAAVGAEQMFEGERIEARYHSDLRGQPLPRPAFVVRPGSTEEVAAVLRAASRHGVPVTTQGGRTGVVGGADPGPDGIALSLERMNRILEIDPAAMTMTVEAGCVLQTAHEAAEAQGMILPLDLGARGTATIGGNIATNAGGVRVLRWGMMRDMVLGVEAVLADGTVLPGLRKTIKDNAGYDWKHLLIGSEGTLGVVTKAVLRLRPAPRTTSTALLSLVSFDDAVALLRRLESDLGGALSTFELMWDDFYNLITAANAAKRTAPLPAGALLYALVETLGADPESDPDKFEQVLAGTIADGLATDAVIAQSGADRERLWAVREDLNEPFATLWPIFAFDVSVAVSDMTAFVAAAKTNVLERFPDARVITYGHIGDGNLHLMVGVGKGDGETHRAVDTAVFEAVQRFGGSISAEHGVGTAKRDYLGYSRAPSELALMKALKVAIDPGNILNPGKIFPA